jgi:hypothetical protein
MVRHVAANAPLRTMTGVAASRRPRTARTRPMPIQTILCVPPLTVRTMSPSASCSTFAGPAAVSIFVPLRKQRDAVSSVGRVVRNVVPDSVSGRFDSCAAESPQTWLFWNDSAVGLPFSMARAESDARSLTMVAGDEHRSADVQAALLAVGNDVGIVGVRSLLNDVV